MVLCLQKKYCFNKDIFEITTKYLVTDLNNLLSIGNISIENIKNLIETNIKLFYISNNIKYKINAETFCRVMKLVDKYDYYNNEYYLYKIDEMENPYFHLPLCSHPILLDALFSGCSLSMAYSSKKCFTDEIFSDIREIIYLIPETINSTWGKIRCRQGITPLYAACINNEVPLKVIEFLLSKGANKNHNIKVNGYQVTILSDLYDNINIIGNIRYEEIKKLFEKY